MLLVDELTVQEAVDELTMDDLTVDELTMDDLTVDELTLDDLTWYPLKMMIWATPPPKKQL